ncbi:hypothetical protein SAMN05428963_107232 [Consotaella salsifontis]|uniref:Uncharacterized protein n=1 Tax=Consotaella salsifontis TaxID=1365950 RepID=A0A1T4RSM2_9HYPH|nr:hypothetical protein SAMN05428963_107232 [Consotaella salsifontis]
MMLAKEGRRVMDEGPLWGRAQIGQWIIMS